MLVSGFPIIEIGLIILAVVWWLGQKTILRVLLTTTGGEMEALSSTNGAFISKVVKAISDVIVSRGDGV